MEPEIQQIIDNYLRLGRSMGEDSENNYLVVLYLLPGRSTAVDPEIRLLRVVDRHTPDGPLNKPRRGREPQQKKNETQKGGRFGVLPGLHK